MLSLNNIDYLCCNSILYKLLFLMGHTFSAVALQANKKHVENKANARQINEVRTTGRINPITMITHTKD